MKKIKFVAVLFAMLAFSMACKDDEKNTNVVDDGADKSGVTETGQRIGSTTDSTSVQSDEPNPSNY